MSIFTVADMQGDNVELIQDRASIDQFNADYDEEFDYYFMQLMGDKTRLWGSFGIQLNKAVFCVGYV